MIVGIGVKGDPAATVGAAGLDGGIDQAPPEPSSARFRQQDRNLRLTEHFRCVAG